jgi:hypothetical protein
MTGSDLAPALISSTLSAILLGVSLRLRRKQRLLADLPTSKTQGVFIGLVELCGSAESAQPLTSFLAERLCVYYAFDVQEKWQRTVTETTTDKDGKTHTTTRTETGWTTIAHNTDCQDFYLRDDTGVILIRPGGAKLEPNTIFDETVTPDDALYFAKAPGAAIANSCHVRRFVERAIVVQSPLYIVGQARERSDIVAPEIAAAKEAPLFLISTRTEKSIQRGEAIGSWFCWGIGLALAVAATAMVEIQLAEAGRNLPAPHAAVAWSVVAGAALYVAAWGTFWLWMVFNSLVGLRQRVRQAWSLIDVQLKRRHDLIPSLVELVARLSGHEQATQTAVAALRTQLAATAPGVAGPDFDGVAGQIGTVAEKYPELVAQEGFTHLHRTLIETEQRIALARTYYNDIATQFATRLERIPDRWVAVLARMQPEPLLSAANFERAPVEVSLAPAR